MLIHQQISTLLQHIQKYWNRANGQDDHISRIDRDILTNDLRKLYDLIYELDLAGAGNINSTDLETKFSVTKQKRETETTESIPDSFKKNQAPQPEHLVMADEEEITEMPPRQNPGEIVLEVVNEPESFQPEVDEPFETRHEESQSNKIEDPLNHFENTPPESPKTTKLYNSDKFTAPKTFADIYSRNGDNSLAAKIQKNNIRDIKTAIGINDRFLFINSIFNGDADAYKTAIEQFSNFETYMEALHLSEVIKAKYSIKDDHALGKLMEIVRRKFI